MKHAERAHARFSPSQAYRIKECPGSVALCEQAPPEPPSPYAEEGTRAHEHLERLMIRTRASDWDTVPEDMRPHLRVFTDYVDEVLKEGVFEMNVESKLDIPGIPGAGGTVDCLLLDKQNGRIEVIDLKYGQGVLVEVDDNPQLKQYALAVVMNLKPPEDWRVRITIIQPRGQHHEGPIRSVDMTAGDLYDFSLEVLDMVEEASKPDAPRNPGKWCNWCQARTICPEIQELAAKTCRADFSNIKEVTTDLMDEKVVEDRIGDILTAGVIIKRWLSSVEKLAVDRLRNGEEIEGWKLVAQRPTRKWRSDLKEFEIISKLRTVLPDHGLGAIAPRKLIGVTASDELAAAQAKLMGGNRSEIAENKKLLINGVAECIEKTSSGAPKLAPESDPRPPLVIGQDFANTEVKG